MKLDYIIHELNLNKYLNPVMEIETRNFPDPWPVSAFIEVWMWGYLLWGVFQSDNLIGYLIAAKRNNRYHIANVVIDIPFRRLGAGRGILRKLIQHAKEEKVKRIFLEVRKSNHAAIMLYKSEGFIQSGEKSDYYEDSESALIFSCDLG